MSKKSASRSGTIRQRSDGRWEARISYRDELGQPRRKSVYGPTQQEVRKKMTAIIKAVDDGSYHEHERYTMKQWLEIWQSTYGTDWKPRTVDDYKRKAERYIIPVMGAVQLSALTPIRIQRFVNQLSQGTDKQRGLAPKSVKNIHGILHSCLKQAVADGLIPANPADNTRLPKSKKAELSPVMDDDVSRFVTACCSDRYGRLYMVAMFTGLRQSELLGLKWSDIVFQAGTIHVQRQLQKRRESPDYLFLQTKNGKDRIVPFPPAIGDVLKQEYKQQSIWRLAAGPAWKNDDGLVFTTEEGSHLSHSTIQNNFRKFRTSLGLSCRFHDLRHSCAILALQSGVNIKAVSDMLGHYSSSFTMDVYADVSKAMQQDTQDKLEAVFRAASNH